MAETDQQPDQRTESEVWSAISAFEQILQAMPQDRTALECLVEAYEQIGDHTSAHEYMLRLGDVLLDDGDAAGAARVAAKLKLYADENPKIQDFVSRCEAASPVDISAMAEEDLTISSTVSPAVDSAVEHVTRGFSMADELFFAWNLMEGGQITQEEYASIVHDLTEMSAGDAVTTVSVLHVLEGRTFRNLERIVAFTAQECSTPIISLSNFDIQYSAVSRLPIELMVRRGVVVFEEIGSDLLVVVMNPYNKQLRGDVQAVLERKCHFFLSLPSEFDAALQKAAEILEEHIASEATG